MGFMNIEIVLGKMTKIASITFALIWISYILLVCFIIEWPIWLRYVTFFALIGSIVFLTYAIDSERDDYYRSLYLSIINSTVENSVQARFKYLHNRKLENLGIEGLKCENGKVFVKFLAGNKIIQYFKSDYVNVEEIPTSILKLIRENL